MVRGLSREVPSSTLEADLQDGSTPHRAGRDGSTVDTTALLGRIASSLRRFPPHVADDGRRYAGRIGKLEWWPRRRAFTLPVDEPERRHEGRRLSHEVTIALGTGPLRELGRSCTCDLHRRVGECPHLYAGLYHLYSELSATPERTFPLEVDREVAGRAGEPWTACLERLDSLLGGNADTGPAAGPCTRLLWRVELCRSPGLEIDVVPYEQRLLPSGSWSRGRRLSWQRLAAEARLWNDPRDRDVLELLRERAPAANALAAGGPAAIEPFEVLERLAGHPHVFGTDPERPIAVRAGRATLSLTFDEDGRLRLAPALDGMELRDRGSFVLSRRGIACVNDGNDEIAIARLEPSCRALLEHILDERPTFPREARAELLARLPALAALLPVRLPDELETRSVPADERIHVQLAPLACGGLSVALRFRPLPGGGDWAPGEGPPVSGRLMGECWVTAKRLFSRERRIALEAADRLDLDVAGSPGETAPERGAARSGWRWRIEGPERSLDLLAKLRSGVVADAVIEWPEGGERRVLAERARPAALRVAITDRGDLFGLDGFLELGASRLSLALLFESMRRGARYVPVGDDTWVELSDALRAHLEALADATHEGRSGLEVGPAVAGALAETMSAFGSVEACASWKDLEDRFRRASREAPPLPAGLRTTLREYQLEGFRWMHRLAACGLGACLADDMGLGKTVETLAVLLGRAGEGPALVVAPTSVAGNWVREAERFAPGLRPVLYRDTERSLPRLRFRAGDLVVVSYGLLRRDVEKLSRVAWGTVVLDEAQHAKNSRSETARAARALQAGWRLALTGTPIENHLGELWSLFRFLSPGLLGSWDEFRRRFAEPIEKGRDALKRSSLAALTRPFILRRTKSEVLRELPPRTDITLEAVLSPPERALYEDARLAALASLAGRSMATPRDTRFAVLGTLTRLRQLACHPKLVHPELELPSAKMALFLELLESLREGRHRALVFSQFTRHLQLIRAELDARGVDYCYLDGQTPPEERMRQVDTFQGGRGDVFLISLKAGGTGLNLTRADYVIHMDPWWNPAVEDQATDRAHRMGQERPVTVYRLVAEGTVEEEIQKMQASKRELIRGVLDGSDLAAKLSTDELLDLIVRARPDVAEADRKRRMD